MSLISELGCQVRLLRGDHLVEGLLNFSKWVRRIGHSKCVQTMEASNSLWSLENTNNSVRLARGNVWKEVRKPYEGENVARAGAQTRQGYMSARLESR